MAIIIFFFLCGYLASVFSAGMQKKAGYNIIEAFIPIKGNLNMAIMIGKPKYWALLSYTPVFNFFVLATMFSDLARAFGRERFYEYFISMVFPFAYLPYVGFNQEDKYIGVPSKEKKGGGREWADAISFALIAATLIRWSTFEAYTIPTPSMEGSLLVGDFLFVSKLHYGPRTPITPLQVPLTHQYLWLTGDEMKGKPGVKAYSDLIQLPYNRISGITTIKNNDVVVFNWPADEVHEPIDLKTNYIKRCIAIAGDTFRMDDKEIFINGKKTDLPVEGQYLYRLYLNDNLLTKDRNIQDYCNTTLDRKIYDKVGLHPESYNGNVILQQDTIGVFLLAHISETKLKLIDKLGNYFKKRTFNLPGYYKYQIDFPSNNQDTLLAILDSSKIEHSEIESIISGEKRIYISAQWPQIKDLEKNNIINSSTNLNGGEHEKPYFASVVKDVNNVSSILIPYKGLTITINKETIGKYGSTIAKREHLENVVLTDDKITIDGKEISEYTFKQNYYFMMGDNRNNSQDSRYWGFVPEDHVVGKAALIWFSLSSEPGFILSRIRWSRMLNLID